MKLIITKSSKIVDGSCEIMYTHNFLNLWGVKYNEWKKHIYIWQDNQVDTSRPMSFKISSIRKRLSSVKSPKYKKLNRNTQFINITQETSQVHTRCSTSCMVVALNREALRSSGRRLRSPFRIFKTRSCTCLKMTHGNFLIWKIFSDTVTKPFSVPKLDIYVSVM